MLKSFRSPQVGRALRLLACNNCPQKSSRSKGSNFFFFFSRQDKTWVVWSRPSANWPTIGQHNRRTGMTLQQFVDCRMMTNTAEFELSKDIQHQGSKTKQGECAARQRRMTSFFGDAVFVIPAPYSWRPLYLSLVGIKGIREAKTVAASFKRSERHWEALLLVCKVFPWQNIWIERKNWSIHPRFI